MSNEHARKRAADAAARVRPLTPEQQVLVARHRGLVPATVKKHVNVRTRLRLWDDLVGAGFLGLVRAAQGYDPAAGKFSTYAVYHVRKAVADEIDRLAPIPLPLGAGRDILSEATRAAAERARRPGVPLDALGDVLPARDGPGGGAADVREALEGALRSLPAAHRDILRAWALAPDASHGDILAALGLAVSRQRVQQIITQSAPRLLGAMRRILGGR